MSDRRYGGKRISDERVPVNDIRSLRESLLDLVGET